MSSRLGGSLFFSGLSGLARLFHKGTLPAWLFYPLTLYSNTMHYKNKNDILYNLLIYNSLYALRFGYAVSLLSPKRALSANKLSHAADYESTSCTFAVFVYLYDNDSFITVSAPLHEISGLGFSLALLYNNFLASFTRFNFKGTKYNQT